MEDALDTVKGFIQLTVLTPLASVAISTIGENLSTIGNGIGQVTQTFAATGLASKAYEMIK